MIIVYYDSFVQIAFEELVKSISGSGNAMRKGKMAAKTAEMLRTAELEVEADDDEGEDLPTGIPAAETLVLRKMEAPDTDDSGDFSILTLRYVSTRNIGPSREYTRADNFGSTLSVGLLRGYRRGGNGSTPDIFDELKKGLEGCQSQCEHVAYQFLRDGECSQEIENIKRKLDEVRVGLTVSRIIIITR